ncbi:phage tail protein [Wohlfahrtiimonas larvae]|uniref:Oxidoreductase n=1 Tax=Wohlfahrtiimonas larvae TaxID=1157986 RepID=A0ABP9N1P9_9GAMM
MKIQMVWGFFPFSLESLPYEKFDKKSGYKYAFNSRVGTSDAPQFLGKGEEIITLTGKLLPFVTGGRNAIELLRLQASSGQGFPLIERTGRIHGNYICLNADEVARQFEHTGAPHIVDFSIQFRRVGDDLLGAMGVITSQVGSLL